MKAKVLIVDDEPDIRALLEHALADKFEVHSAGSGGHAKIVASEVQPAIVICDYQLTDTDGLSLIKHLQQALPAARFVLLTGLLFDPSTSRELGEKYSLVYLPKTTPLRQIIKQVEQSAGLAS